MTSIQQKKQQSPMPTLAANGIKKVATVADKSLTSEEKSLIQGMKIDNLKRD